MGGALRYAPAHLNSDQRDDGEAVRHPPSDCVERTRRQAARNSIRRMLRSAASGFESRANTRAAQTRRSKEETVSMTMRCLARAHAHARAYRAARRGVGLGARNFLPRDSYSIVTRGWTGLS